MTPLTPQERRKIKPVVESWVQGYHTGKDIDWGGLFSKYGEIFKKSIPDHPLTLYRSEHSDDPEQYNRYTAWSLDRNSEGFGLGNRKFVYAKFRPDQIAAVLPNLGFNFKKQGWFDQNEVIVKPGAYKTTEHKYIYRPREEGGTYFPHPADNTRTARLASRIDLEDIARDLDKLRGELQKTYVKHQEYRRFLRDLQDLARAAERRIAAPRKSNSASMQQDYRTFLEVLPWILRHAREIGRKPNFPVSKKRILAKEYLEKVLKDKLGHSPRLGHWIRLAKGEVEKVLKQENLLTPEYY